MKKSFGKGSISASGVPEVQWRLGVSATSDNREREMEHGAQEGNGERD